MAEGNRPLLSLERRSWKPWEKNIAIFDLKNTNLTSFGHQISGSGSGTGSESAMT
jgi:hypothetical protein